MKNYLFVFIGGGMGCITRSWIYNYIHKLSNCNLIYGVLLVNITGSFLAGILSTIILKYYGNTVPAIQPLLLIGFLGGYTTFSAFSLETMDLFIQKEIFKAMLNILLNCAGSIIAVWLGVVIGKQI